MSISPLSSPSSSTPSTSDPITGLAMNRKTGNRTLDSDDFMKILMTQLTAQDPMNPMKDTEFIAQMANFSSLEQMRGLSKAFDSFANQQKLSASPTYLGCEVTVKDPSSDTGEVKGIVESITLKDGTPALVINGKSYDPNLITHISLPPAPIPAEANAATAISQLNQPTTELVQLTKPE
jgi:flagellar basal-body rod modification protein FlgD